MPEIQCVILIEAIKSSNLGLVNSGIKSMQFMKKIAKTRNPTNRVLEFRKQGGSNSELEHRGYLYFGFGNVGKYLRG